MKPARFYARNFGAHRTWAERLAERHEPDLRTLLQSSVVANDVAWDPARA